MDPIEYLYRGTRDVIGGGFGGLIAAWTLADINQSAVTVLGAVFIILLGATYWMFDLLKRYQKPSSDDEQDNEPDIEELAADWIDHNWPNNHAS